MDQGEKILDHEKEHWRKEIVMIYFDCFEQEGAAMVELSASQSLVALETAGPEADEL